MQRQVHVVQRRHRAVALGDTVSAATVVGGRSRIAVLTICQSASMESWWAAGSGRQLGVSAVLADSCQGVCSKHELIMNNVARGATEILVDSVDGADVTTPSELSVAVAKRPMKRGHAMSHNFILCARAIKRSKFVPEPGPSRYLKVPKAKGPILDPQDEIEPKQWVEDLRQAATWRKAATKQDRDRGDLIVFVHGYNNDAEIIVKRHNRLEQDLRSVGYKGAFMTFCWPSDSKALNYLEDRHDAKKSAMQLVSDGIKLLSMHQRQDCSINIHLIGHSTGAYVIREAFDDADDSALPNNSWSVSQIAFIGADLSAESMREGNPVSASLYRHCHRLTNYYSNYDSALKLSNAKRVGVAPRVGRVGLPSGAPRKAVDVDCSEYFDQLNGSEEIQSADQFERLGSFDHSWHIGNRIFALDLFETIKGDLDRAVVPTRREKDGKLVLTRV